MKVRVEKYRPKKLEDLANQEEAKKKLAGFIKTKNMPNLLLAGPPGSGKTTAALILAREILGEDFEENFLELNASDARGIDVIRTIVKDFARSKPSGGAPFRILLLDEADSMTQDAQHALRRIMEMYSDNCRFILIANYSSKIIEPIQSRCVFVKFRSIEPEDVVKVLKRICEEEGLICEEEALEAIAEISEGDLRKAINSLQATAAASDGRVTKKLALEVIGAIQLKEAKELLELALSKKVNEARKKLVDLFVDRGLSGIDVVKAFYRNIRGLEIREESKIELMKALSEVEFRISEGADPIIQLTYFLAEVAKAKRKSKRS